MMMAMMTICRALYISMLQQHAHCAFKMKQNQKKRKKRKETSLVQFNFQQTYLLRTGRSSDFSLKFYHYYNNHHILSQKCFLAR